MSPSESVSPRPDYMRFQKLVDGEWVEVLPGRGGVIPCGAPESASAGRWFTPLVWYLLGLVSGLGAVLCWLEVVVW